MEMYDNENTIEKSFDENYLSEELIQAQWAEFIELKKVISELYLNKKSPITILDIGVGNGRIAKHLSGIDDIWQMIVEYDGTDNAEACVALSKQTAKSLKIDDKFSIFHIDATNLNQWDKKYDLIISTWFTAGNFYPENFSFENYSDSKKTLDLTKNEKFEIIFSNAYDLLNPGGEIVIGACYIENDGTRKKQEQSYLKMGMQIITTSNDSFTATKEGFWSQRFTPKKLQNYLHFVEKKKISFILLDTYNYAMQVRIKK